MSGNYCGSRAANPSKFLAPEEIALLAQQWIKQRWGNSHLSPAQTLIHHQDNRQAMVTGPASHSGITDQ